MLMNVNHDGQVFAVDVPYGSRFKIGHMDCLIVPNLSGDSPPEWYIPMSMVVDLARLGLCRLSLGNRVIPDVDGDGEAVIDDGQHGTDPDSRVLGEVVGQRPVDEVRQAL